jgi:adenosylcobinamide-GDP ribazoletransferase
MEGDAMAQDEPLFDPQDLAEAFGLLTVLPAEGAGRGARAAWAWPLVGVAVALIAALVAWILRGVGLVPGLVAAAALATQALVTGAMHEDGLGDSADGLFGGWTVAERLEIMKDSRVGSFGLMAILLVTLGRWSALTFLFATGHVLGPLLAAAVLSRAALPLAMLALPQARSEGLSAATGTPPREAVGLALILALGLALVWIGWSIFAALVGAGLMALAVALVAQARIGGQTGDVLGAMQQMAELGVLAALTAAL